MKGTSESRASNYRDVAQSLYLAILAGEYIPGQKLPSLRQLSNCYRLSVATVARGIAEIERSGLVVLEKSRKRSVTKDKGKIRAIKEQYIAEQVALLKKRLHELNFTDEDIAKLAASVFSNKTFF
jgi:DNA-binding transcriptional regulator YhcF (GntR family)